MESGTAAAMVTECEPVVGAELEGKLKPLSILIKRWFEKNVSLQVLFLMSILLYTWVAYIENQAKRTHKNKFTGAYK